MILAFILIIGCFVTAIVALGVVFAFAAVGYGSEGEPEEPSTSIDTDPKEDS